MTLMSPWTFHAHPGGWGLLAGAGAAYLVTTRARRGRASAKERRAFLGGLLVLAVALGWPLSDLAAHWSLLALVLQRLLLVLAAPPLLLKGLPRSLAGRLTRPAPVDALTRNLLRAPVAVVVVTAVAVGTLTTGAVEAQASSIAVRGLLDVVVLGAGCVLWAPVLGVVPGSPRPAPPMHAAYLIVQSIVPSFLSLVWIFARHPLYRAFGRGRVAGMSPLLDQQLSGFTAKFMTIAVLWTVAFVVLLRGRRVAPGATGGPPADGVAADGVAARPGGAAAGEEPDVLDWDDVVRALERADRGRRRAPRAGRWLPPP